MAAVRLTVLVAAMVVATEARADDSAAASAEEPATLRIDVATGGATVRVDGVRIAPDPDSSTTLSRSLAAGVHTVVVKRPGRQSWQAKVHATPGETVDLNLQLGRRQGTASRTVMWAIGGGGFAVMFGGFALGVKAHLQDREDLAAPADALILGGSAAMVIARTIYWLVGDTPTRVELTRRQ